MKQKRKLRAAATGDSKKPTRQRRLVQQPLVATGASGSGAPASTVTSQHAEDEPGKKPQLHELRVVSVRQALRSGSFSASFKRQHAGWTVFNVTSKSQDAGMVQLSPFFCHNGIPVPGLPGTIASSVERIWQCLKVFERAPEDLASLGKLGMTGVKRTSRKHGKVLGHAWFGGSAADSGGDDGDRAVGSSGIGGGSRGGSGPDGSPGTQRQLLAYVQARERIYLPAYSWVLQHKVQAELRRIAQAALQQPVVLLDYEVNCDVGDSSRPLSHAGLVAAHVRKHWRSLVA